jgi:hypothetical protein
MRMSRTSQWTGPERPGHVLGRVVLRPGVPNLRDPAGRTPPVLHDRDRALRAGRMQPSQKIAQMLWLVGIERHQHEIGSALDLPFRKRRNDSALRQVDRQRREGANAEAHAIGDCLQRYKEVVEAPPMSQTPTSKEQRVRVEEMSQKRRTLASMTWQPPTEESSRSLQGFHRGHVPCDRAHLSHRLDSRFDQSVSRPQGRFPPLAGFRQASRIANRAPDGAIEAAAHPSTDQHRMTPDKFQSWTWTLPDGGQRNDIAALEAGGSRVLARGGWQRSALGLVGGDTLWLLERPARHPDAPHRLIAAGFHGEEPAGPWGVLRYFEAASNSELNAVHLCVLPVVNATGFRADTRFNAWGENPNRGHGRHAGAAPSREGRRPTRYGRSLPALQNMKIRCVTWADHKGCRFDVLDARGRDV